MAEITKKRKKRFFTVKTIFATIALAIHMIGRLFSLLSVYFENIDYIFNSQNNFQDRLRFALDLTIRGIGDYILYHATAVTFIFLIFYFGLEGLGRRRKRLVGMAFFLNALAEMVSSFGYYYYNAKNLETGELLSGYFTSLLTVAASVVIALYGFRKLKSRRLVIVASAALVFSSLNFALENFGGHTFMIFLTASPALIAICGLYVLIFVHFIGEKKLEERLAREAMEEQMLFSQASEPGFFDDFESTEEFDLTDEILIKNDDTEDTELNNDDEPTPEAVENKGNDGEEWECSCGNKPNSNFCTKCGNKRPE